MDCRSTFEKNILIFHLKKKRRMDLSTCEFIPEKVQN